MCARCHTRPLDPATCLVERGEPLVELAHLGARAGVAGLEFEHRLQLADGGVPAILENVDAGEIQVREVARLVARRAHGPLEPRYGFLGTAELDEVGADVVVGIAELRIQGDGGPTVGNGLVEPALRAQRPAEKGVSLRRRLDGDGLRVELDGLIESLLHLGAVPLFEVPPGVGRGVLEQRDQTASGATVRGVGVPPAIGCYARLRYILKRMLRPACSVLLTIAVLAGCATSRAGDVRVRFPNATPGAARQVPGTLYWAAGDGPFPAVVLFHGCHGVSASNHGWARWLRERGYVALIVDSWGARGIADGCAAEQPDVPNTERFDDAMGALRFLQTQPRVDGARVGIMGWSNGGVFAMAVVNGPSLERAARRGVMLPEPGYQASVALYPGGCASLTGEYVVKPLLLLIGEDDDWTLARTCREMIDNMRSRGASAEIVLYAGAYHYFDVEGQAKAFLPDVGNENRPGGAGATVAFNGDASSDAHRRVEQFLSRYLGRR
jgi:dienelactone hydrolase